MGNCFGSNSSVHNANSGPSNPGTSPSVTNNPLQLKSSPPKSTKVSNPGSCDVPRQPADANGGTLHAFTYADLRTATRNFRLDSLLGEGGFGSVYKGYIDEQTYMPARPHQGMVIAVKRLNPEGLQGHKEWMAEVYFLGALRHPNLVKLIGFCAEDEHRLLVYEFMPRGSLENHLFRKGTHKHTLSWAVRMKIVIGAARGLTFLHDTERPVIFRDFKSSNVLLDSNYNAKLSDFGLARDGPTGDNTHVSTRIIGTYGYAAPEYVATGHLTSKSDVYSFGVVLLEILTGHRAVDKNRPDGEQNLVEWAKPYLTDKRRFLRIIDQKLEGQYSLKGAQRIAQVANNCLFQEPKTRPSMREILESLEPLLNTRELSKYTQSPAKGESGSDVDTKNDVQRNDILKSNLIHASPKNSLDGQHQSPKVGGFVDGKRAQLRG